MRLLEITSWRATVSPGPITTIQTELVQRLSTPTPFPLVRSLEILIITLKNLRFRNLTKWKWILGSDITYSYAVNEVGWVASFYLHSY